MRVEDDVLDCEGPYLRQPAAFGRDYPDWNTALIQLARFYERVTEGIDRGRQIAALYDQIRLEIVDERLRTVDGQRQRLAVALFGLFPLDLVDPISQLEVDEP